jgi:hypothetical protein
MQWQSNFAELKKRELFEDVIDCSNYEGLGTAPESTRSSSFHVLTLIIESHRPEVMKLVKTLVSLSKYQSCSACFSLPGVSKSHPSSNACQIMVDVCNVLD